MSTDRWNRLSDWHNAWLNGDSAERRRLRNELTSKSPDLVAEAEALAAASLSITGFLETPAFVLTAAQLASDEAAMRPGTLVGPYQINALIARGGMGIVYRATDTRLDRQVALKMLAPLPVRDELRVERFLREARITASLDHPNIVKVYDVGTHDGQPFMVVELLEGETLRGRLDRGPVAEADVRRMGIDIARGLVAANAAGLVHRDLKPENVFLTRAGVTKILDFGIAKLAPEAVPRDSGASTLTGILLGTAGYLAPEQIQGREADGRADLFALGSILFEMLTGQRAFACENTVDTLHAIVHDAPPDLLHDRTDISASMETIVSRLLRKAPEDRFQAAADVVWALEQPSTHTERVRARIDPAKAGPTLRVHARTWIAVLAAVVLAAVSAGAFFWNRWSRPAINSVAVLPFDNTAEDPEIDYIGDGLTDGLIDHLSRAASLTVKARATVMRFKGEREPQKAARALGVGAVVTGALSRRGTQIVISAELIHGATGERLWGQTFDRPMTDLMRVQDSIVLAIAEGLRLRLSGAAKARLGGFGTNNPEAYELFLKGRFMLQSDTEEGDLEARKLFVQAAERDPNFLGAHLAIASTYARSAGVYAPPREAAVHADAALAKAAAIDPNNVAVRVAMAHQRFTATHDWAAAEREYRAVMHDPALLRTMQYHPISVFFVAIGRADEAVALVERALVVDPGNLESRVMLGNFLLQDGRLDEALRVYAAIGAEVPKDPRPLFGTADVYKRRGDFARAADARGKAHGLASDPDAARAFAGVTTEAEYAKAEVTVARAQLRQLEQLAAGRYIPQFDIARLHAQIGNRQQALAGLEQAAKEGGYVGLALLKVDQAWDSVRADPRFAAVVRRLGIP
jgi:TolB-like protein/tRNA A-37 threonylcarbamoyl transferase component Bud32/Tfp pilus assembly protein PilF